MNNKFNIIKISGFKGLIVAAFVVCCLFAGFLMFPGWVCMHLWNFTAGFFEQMPSMTMVHGILLWCIIALSLYALNKGNFSISIGHSVPLPRNDERIKEIIRQINERNAKILSSENIFEDKGENSDKNNENNDKIVK